jgi:hypothetical protein
MIHATNVAILRIDTDGLDASRAIHLPTLLEMRGLRAKATIKDIMPSVEDDAHIKKSFTCLIAQLLALYSPDSGEWSERGEILERLKGMMPQDRPMKAQKTDARPFGVIDVNEGSKRGIVDVLKEIGGRTSLTPQEWSSKTRLILGDWLTSSNLRAARRDRFDEKTAYGNLSYAKELSQPWHFALQATHAIIRTHLGNAIQDPTSLSAHKDLLRRIWDVNKPNYAAAKSLIRHSLIARLLHIVMYVPCFQTRKTAC